MSQLVRARPSHFVDGPPPMPALQEDWRPVHVFVAGVLVMGGVVGFFLNPLARSKGVAPVEMAERSQEPAEEEFAGEPEPVDPLPVPAALWTKGARVRGVARVIPPEDPFQPTQADPSTAPAMLMQPNWGLGLAAAGPPALPLPYASAPAQRVALPPTTLSVQAVVPRGPATPPRSLPNPAPTAVTRPVLTGLVQGDPPVALARWEGQTVFLKVGDTIAGTWQLIAINENSAVFRLGAQRVELHIQGGSE